MTLADRLRKLLDALPADGSATLSAATLAAWLADAEDAPQGHDLSPAEVGARLGRSAATVRRWCAQGRMRGYQLAGRDWRITEQALAEYRRGQLPPATLGAWRNVSRRRSNGR